MKLKSLQLSNLAHRVRLAGLALQRVLLALVVRVAVLVSRVSTVANHMPERGVSERQDHTHSDTYCLYLSIMDWSIASRVCRASLISVRRLSQRFMLKSSRTTTRISFSFSLLGAIV